MKSSPQFSLIFLLFPFVAKALPLFRTKHVNAIFSFGDSYADTGNFVVLASPVLNDTIWINKPPYGQTFFHQPTGRCSDGRLVIDFVGMNLFLQYHEQGITMVTSTLITINSSSNITLSADELGLPFVPPYLSHNESFSKGANFAVSGATAMDYEFFVKNNLTNNFIFNSSLYLQLSWFDELKQSLCNTPDDCWDYFGGSLFVLGEIGGNDYAYMLFFGWSVDQAMAYVPQVISVISSAVEKLINEGATAIVIPGTWPAGCTSINLAINMNASTNAYDPRTGCIWALNELHRNHNRQLHMEIIRLRLRYPRVTLIYTDYYSLVIDFFQFPEHFGFIRAPLMACCGNGNNQYNINITEACGMPGVRTCQDPSTYVNWDGAHLTEAAYRYIASSWLRGPYADPPILLALHY